MVNEEVVESFNNKLRVDLSNISKLTAAQKDQVRHYGSLAEELIKNRNLAMFIHHYKFDVADQLGGIRSHSVEDNAQRIALANELAGIDNFVNSLKRAVYWKDRVGKVEIAPNI